ncbi:hypothetical protein BKA65DRAFT_560434 [Rhexocercosporidium sp. MPI-PUGE-AT-0058]|nr:hypothetical protein BKA65DRAFT_560434 [Rhexocercosporidium sp. MPI-PUGE-AT-0058]
MAYGVVPAAINGGIGGGRGHGIGGRCEAESQEDDAKGLDESTPWLKHYIKWPTRFKGRPLNILAITKKPPATSPKIRRAGLTAGTHRGVSIRWDGQFEERLHTIMVALRQMLERCLSTLDITET